VERRGLLEHVEGLAFYNNAHLLQIIQRIVGRVGRRVDESSPMVDARLPDGSRVNAIIPPLALDGPLLSIRRFGTKPLTSEGLLANNSLTCEMLTFLTACIESRLSVLISGGTGSGKTTLLNVLSGAIPSSERIATIEDSAELRLQQRHVVRMETRPSNIEGQGQITQRDLVRNALRMRPDRIIVGECRGGEAIDMLQAMNTGHEGSLTTIHANSARDATSRLEVMVGMAGYEMPIWVVRRQIASAINLVVQVARLSGGLRKVVSVSEITGMEGDVISMHDIFLFRQTGIDSKRRALGYFCSTGVRPHCLKRLEAYGVSFSANLFEARMMTDNGQPRNCEKAEAK
jgi:pilus assembly protein CpaF